MRSLLFGSHHPVFEESAMQTIPAVEAGLAPFSAGYCTRSYNALSYIHSAYAYHVLMDLMVRRRSERMRVDNHHISSHAGFSSIKKASSVRGICQISCLWIPTLSSVDHLTVPATSLAQTRTSSLPPCFYCSSLQLTANKRCSIEALSSKLEA